MEGIIWRFRTGSPWRDLPEQFGAWQSVAERHLRWSTDGTYAQIFAAIAHDIDEHDADLAELLLAVDSTSVRVHQHAAGARPGRHTGDLPNYKKYPDSTRARLRQMKIAHTIPERSDQINRRKAKGRKGGRPPGFSGRIYKHRNTIERCFNRLKHWRAIATRYDKYALSYLGGVTLAAIVTFYRVRN